jgi:hypothetical protein
VSIFTTISPSKHVISGGYRHCLKPDDTLQVLSHTNESQGIVAAQRKKTKKLRNIYDYLSFCLDNVTAPSATKYTFDIVARSQLTKCQTHMKESARTTRGFPSFPQKSPRYGVSRLIYMTMRGLRMLSIIRYASFIGDRVEDRMLMLYSQIPSPQ